MDNFALTLPLGRNQWIPLIDSFVPGKDCNDKVIGTLKSGNMKA